MICVAVNSLRATRFSTTRFPHNFVKDNLEIVVVFPLNF